ncbi:pleckstrin homology domain-containing family S member 1-like isoform 3-T3 [Sarcophilus harrisii]
MASKTEAYSGKQVPFYYENEVCRQAHFIKSPPPQLFSSQASWKNRFFILSKNEKNCYSLQYFKDHHCQGSIEIDQISSIQVGISNHEKMASVQKMFKCLPDEVMSIITPKRDYFLIGKDWRTIEDWVSFISSSCLDLKVTHQNAKNINLVNQDARNKASVVQPLDSKENIYQIISEIDDDVQEKHFSEERRPVSYPGHCSDSLNSSEGKICSSLPRNSLPDMLNDIIASSEDKEFAESKESDQVSKPTDHLYMSMKSCFDEEKFQQSFNSKEEALPANQDEGLNLQRQEERNKSCHSSSSKEPKTENQKRRLSSLSIVQLSRIINNIPAGSSLEEVDVFLSKNDINKYLTFTQAIGHICVAQWEGPPHLGCIFHQGDRLSAVNDLKPHNLEEVGLFLDRSLKKEVKLTICRIPDSDKFHTVTCACS